MADKKVAGFFAELSLTIDRASFSEGIGKLKALNQELHNLKSQNGIEKINVNLKDYHKTVKTVANTQNTFLKDALNGFKGVSMEVVSLTGKLAGTGVVAGVGLGAFAIKSAITGAGESNKEENKATELGMNVKTYNELANASKLAKTDFDSLAGGLLTLHNAFGGLVGGFVSPEFLANLAKLSKFSGYKIDTENFVNLTSEEQFKTVALATEKGMSKKNETERTASMSAGNALISGITAFVAGSISSGGVSQVLSQGAKSSNIVSGKDIKDASELNKEFIKLGIEWDSAVKMFTASLGRAGLTKGLNDFSTWFETHAKDVTDGLQGLADITNGVVNFIGGLLGYQFESDRLAKEGKTRGFDGNDLVAYQEAGLLAWAMKQGEKPIGMSDEKWTAYSKGETSPLSALEGVEYNRALNGFDNSKDNNQRGKFAETILRLEKKSGGLAKDIDYSRFATSGQATQYDPVLSQVQNQESLKLLEKTAQVLLSPVGFALDWALNATQKQSEGDFGTPGTGIMEQGTGFSYNRENVLGRIAVDITNGNQTRTDYVTVKTSDKAQTQAGR